MCILAVVVLLPVGKPVFWVAGLALTLFVGPAQSASRSFLVRVTPPGHESEIFGLYATTGRAVSFLTPALWTVIIALTGATIWALSASPSSCSPASSSCSSSPTPPSGDVHHEPSPPGADPAAVC